MLQLNFNPFPKLNTERLFLRQVTADDKDDMFALRTNETVLKYLDRDPCPSVEEALKMIDKINDQVNTCDAILWGISLKDDKKLIGTIGYWQIAKEHFRAEIGYVLLPEHHGKGIMQEAISSVLKYGFEVMKLHSVEAKVNPNNNASIKILERNEFVREGYFKEDYYYNGKFLDTAVYSLLTPFT